MEKIVIVGFRNVTAASFSRFTTLRQLTVINERPNFASFDEIMALIDAKPAVETHDSSNSSDFEVIRPTHLDEDGTESTRTESVPIVQQGFHSTNADPSTKTDSLTEDSDFEIVPNVREYLPLKSDTLSDGPSNEMKPDTLTDCASHEYLPLKPVTLTDGPSNELKPNILTDGPSNVLCGSSDASPTQTAQLCRFLEERLTSIPSGSTIPYNVYYASLVELFHHQEKLAVMQKKLKLLAEMATM